MNSFQIDHILKKYHTTHRSFLGCFPSDKLMTVKINIFPCSLIVNTDVSSKPGSHWVALYINNLNFVEYFDSLSETPNEYIMEFLSQFKKVLKNEKMLQNIFSDACGQFCIFFIIKRSLGVSFDYIIRLLYKIKNADHYVKNFVHVLLS